MDSFPINFLSKSRKIKTIFFVTLNFYFLMPITVPLAQDIKDIREIIKTNRSAYIGKNDDEKNYFLQALFELLHRYYINERQMSTAECMLQKVSEVDTNGVQVLYSTSFDAIRDEPRETAIVSEILANMISKELCKDAFARDKFDETVRLAKEATRRFLEELDREEAELRRKLDEMDRNAFKTPDGRPVFWHDERQYYVYEDGTPIPGDMVRKLVPPRR